MAKHLSTIVRTRSCSALLSTNSEADTCVIFVHGFFGNPVTTWAHFSECCDSELLDAASIWGRADLYLYDYGAQNDFVKRSAYDLGNFLKRVFSKPDMDLFCLTETDAPKIRSPWLPYSRLVLVGHSLGAVVIRECVENLLRGARNEEESAWLAACELRLFASAHLGFKPAGLASLALLGPKYITSIPAIWRAYSDLQEDSRTLSDLRRRTEKMALERPDLKCLNDVRLLFGTNEYIVNPGEFDCDKPPVWIDGDHTSVCKPNHRFMVPFQFVSDVHFTSTGA